MAGSKSLTRTTALIFAAILVALTIVRPACAQQYPASTVKIVVPFPAGGPIDLLARTIADKLATSLKQNFVIDNRVGAAGNIGAEAVARAAPDGYTLLLALDSILTVNPALYKKLNFDPMRDFIPIAIVAESAQMLVANPSVPATSLAEFVAYAKGRADHPITFGTGGGIGTPGHLVMEYFRIRAGFPAVHVPYRGTPQVVSDLLAGQVQSGFITAPGVIGLVHEGKLKAFAYSGAQRSPLAPELPTVAESGYPGFKAVFSSVLLAPAGTPDSVVAIIEREVTAAMQSPDLQKKLLVQDIRPVAITGAAAKAQLEAEAKSWAEVIKTANIHAD
jgi:tripartite-type tricarboxylate transporter receptor subunit TctC